MTQPQLTVCLVIQKLIQMLIVTERKSFPWCFTRIKIQLHPDSHAMCVHGIPGPCENYLSLKVPIDNNQHLMHKNMEAIKDHLKALTCGHSP